MNGTTIDQAVGHEMGRKVESIEVVEDAAGRFVVTVYSDGETVRQRVDPNQKPSRRSRIPITRLKRIDHTRKKQF